MPKFVQNTAPNSDLREAQRTIEGFAKDYGLDFFPTLFEVLDYRQMNEVASYGGFPVRYPHWRFGMEYEQLSKSAEYGLSKIYEMVINNTPSIAYLLEGNSMVDQKLVTSTSSRTTTPSRAPTRVSTRAPVSRCASGSTPWPTMARWCGAGPVAWASTRSKSSSTPASASRT